MGLYQASANGAFANDYTLIQQVSSPWVLLIGRRMVEGSHGKVVSAALRLLHIDMKYMPVVG